MKEWIK